MPIAPGSAIWSRVSSPRLAAFVGITRGVPKETSKDGGAETLRGLARGSVRETQMIKSLHRHAALHWLPSLPTTAAGGVDSRRHARVEDRQLTAQRRDRPPHHTHTASLASF